MTGQFAFALWILAHLNQAVRRETICRGVGGRHQSRCGVTIHDRTPRDEAWSELILSELTPR